MRDLDDELLALLLSEDDKAPAAIMARSNRGPARLSFAQQRLWFLHRFDPTSTAYNLTRAYRLKGQLDSEALDKALQAVIRRHAILRTRFDEQEGEVRQVILNAPATRLEQRDLTSLPARDQAMALERAIDEITARSFDLTAAPPLSVTVIRLEPDEHVLVMSLHHILSDGQSNPILARDLMTAYQMARGAREVPSLPGLPVQYTDFADWQRDWLSGERLEQEISYWTGYLGDNLPALDLPTDRQRPAGRTQSGGRHRFLLPPSLAAGLQAFCRDHGYTPFVVLMAAWQTLLARYSGQRDFGVGVPNSGRLQDEVNELVGFFVNTQVFRARLSAETTVSSLCAELRDQVRAALDHASLPFELLLDRLSTPREPGRSPLFQTLFNLQMDSQSAFGLPGLEVEAIQLQETTAKFDLSLDVFYPAPQDEGDVRCELEYASELFDPETVRQMGRHFMQLLAAMIASPDSRIDSLPLIEENEREHLLFNGNRSAAPLRDDTDMLSLFESRAAESPDRIAAVFEASQLTYAQLNRRANQLGRWLVEQGIGPDSLVAVCLPRNADLLVALLAIQKAGGAYLPIDPEQPAFRNDFILQHAEPVLLLTCEETEGEAGQAARVISVEAIARDVAQLPAENLSLGFHPQQLAYTLYTSGSTGKPKGVQIDRRAFVNFLHAMRSRTGITADDRLLAVTTLGFDIAGLELFLPLVVGGCTVLASRTQAHDPGALLSLMDQHDITIMQATPATWSMLLEQADANAALGNVEPADTASAPWTDLQVLCGGEALSAELAARLLARGARLLNVYGPTETTVWSSAWMVDSTKTSPLPIGLPIANNTLHILDGEMEPVPPGVTGELYIGGIGLARGYSRQAGLTATRFLPNPFTIPGAPGSGAGSRLYRSGDLVRRRRDGTIEFIGRCDHQVKIRGFRVETGEVEAALESHPEVRQAVAIACQPEGREKILCAYYTVAAGASSEEDADARRASVLTEHLRARLPGYMVPGLLISLERFPLNANGKVDRAALPAPEFSASQEALALEGDTEHRLAEIWEEVLGVTKIGAGDDFFMLGGHSLHLVRIQVRIRASFESDISLADLFMAPVLRDMAARVDETCGRDEEDDLAFMSELLETL